MKRLQHINKMPDDIVKTLLNVMQTSSVDAFNARFNHIQRQRKQTLFCAKPDKVRIFKEKTCSTIIRGPVSIQKEPSQSSKLEARIQRDTKELLKVPNAGTAVVVAMSFKTARSRSIRIELRPIRRNTLQPLTRNEVPMEDEVVEVVTMEVTVVEDEERVQVLNGRDPIVARTIKE
jgi:hypothetical protein